MDSLKKDQNQFIMKPANQRRNFIKKSSLGTLGLTLLPSLYGKVAASDRLRVAHIGVGGMGNNHIGWFADLPGAPTPDRIIPVGSLPFFFNVAGDQVKYAAFDTFSFGTVPTARRVATG